jgi:spermidine/putrescine-binding protein
VKYRLGIAASLALAALAACGRPHPEPPGASAGTDPAAAPGQFDAEKVLNVYSWMDYIGPKTIANFEKETGITVRYDTYDNNEILETKLLTGHTRYDVVIPTENFFDRQRRGRPPPGPTSPTSCRARECC